MEHVTAVIVKNSVPKNKQTLLNPNPANIFCLEKVVCSLHLPQIFKSTTD